MSRFENEGQSTAGITVPQSPTLATDPLREGANVNGLVKIVETSHKDDSSDTVRNAASEAAAKAAQALAAVDHHLQTSDH